MANEVEDLVLNSLRGGMNDSDPPNTLPFDQCVLAENVEFFAAALGERRNGCGLLDVTGSGLSDESVIVHLSQWFPTNDVLVPEFFAVGATPGVSASVAARTAGTWAELTPTDALNTSNPDIYGIITQSLNGKLFVSYRSTENRLHVRDAGTSNLRRTGLTAPAAPTGANEGAGAYASVRYFRVRYIAKNGATILRRSEPSSVLTFTPSGTGAGVTITKPVAINEGETHWELEGSTDNILFYLVATTVVATTTYNDETAFATGYSAGALSHSIGAYLLQPSARYLAVDGDRLIGAGHWTDTTKQSQIWWTPVYNDVGAGSDERLPTVTTGGATLNMTTNVDNYDGGPITGISASALGTWYVFKWVGIYKMVRTGDDARAYDVVTISKRSGAIQGSIVRGVDENGISAIYYLDPLFGPSRIGPGGPQTIRGLRTTWGTVNLQAASVVARAVFYPYKQQVHWWIATNGANRPNLKIILQVSEIRHTERGVEGGWSTATGRITEAVTAAVFTEIVSINGISSLSERPFIGLTSPDFIQRCDVESTDAGTAYTATIRTRPYLITGLLNRWGAMLATLLATANATSSIKIKFIRDSGLETRTKTVALAASSAAEGFVIKDLDDLAMSDGRMIQIEITDP